jgi:pantoate--beta-alanine ligase
LRFGGWRVQGRALAAARTENDQVAASIFVNPAQFGPGEDLAGYPRDLPRDLALLEAAGVDLVFVPPVEEIYPPGFQTYIEVGEVARGLEGARRPGHFRGVATVVAKLFHIVGPTRAYFGQKDAQQCAVVRQMTHDLALPVTVRVVPTVRAADGLALSSRNSYLTAEQRAAAPVLYRALQAAAALFESGESQANALRQTMRDVLAAEPLARVDYVSVADAATLVELEGTITASALLSMAVYIGRARLIDNVTLSTAQ